MKYNEHMTFIYIIGYKQDSNEIEIQGINTLL